MGNLEGRRAALQHIVIVVVTVALTASACGDDDGSVATTAASTTTVTVAPESSAQSSDPVTAAQERVATAEHLVAEAGQALAGAHETFCTAASGYVETLDRYGRLFLDRDATVGDVKAFGADLADPHEEVVAAADDIQTAKVDLAEAQQELVDAQAALAEATATASSVPNTAAAPTTNTTTTLVPAATLQRVEQAQDDLTRVSSGITDGTPLVEAAAAYNSAALALEIAWLRLLDEAQCLTDEQQANALDQITAYTTAVQEDLQAVGYDPGPIDGVYGPQTVSAVEQFQTDSGLAVTGYVDAATDRALQDLLAAIDEELAREAVIIQTILSVAGFWEGPIDGVWTDELTQALMDFQIALGVEPTGIVDIATIAAFEEALANLQEALGSTTVAVDTTEPAPTAPDSTRPNTSRPNSTRPNSTRPNTTAPSTEPDTTSG